MSFLGLFSRSRRRRHRARRKLAVAAVTLLGLGAMAVAATAYSRLYVFGETLSDVRNLLAAAGIATPPANSGGFDGTFGPGNPVWVEDLAAHLGLSANSSTSGGTHVDVGSLPSNMDGVLPEGFTLPSLAAQIAAGGTPDQNGLYVIQGANAGVFAAAFTGAGATVVASNNGSFTGTPFSDLRFDGPPVIFGQPRDEGGQFVCTGECPPNESTPCLAPCEPVDPPIITSRVCPESECPTQRDPEDCVENCETPTCTDCLPPGTLPALTAQVPEPATSVVLTVGALALLVLVRQRRRPVRIARS